MNNIQTTEDASIQGLIETCKMRGQMASGHKLIDLLPIAIYTTDAQGRITYFNPACVEFSGRVPELGSDRWCVTWKLYYPDGRPMPHDQCPMAIALKEGRAVHGTEAIAERPDGTRIWFAPYPTPLLDDAGNVIGGINMLVDISISEGKQADESRSRLAAIVESSDDAIISKGLDGVITSWNGGAERLFCYSAVETIGHPITMLIPPDRLDEEPKIIERLRRGERVDHFETQRMRKDGSLLDVSLTISPVKDATGQVIGASKVARDITERKRGDQALQRARNYAEATLRTSPVPLLVLESDLRVVTANEAFYQRFMVDPRQTLGHLIYELGNGQWDIPELRQLLEHILPRQEWFEHFEVTHDFESIGRRSMLLNARRMEVEERGPERIVLVIEDITERKAADKALRDSEERFRMVADNITQLAWTCDQLGNVTWYNQRWLDYTGMTFEDMQGWDWKRVHHPDHVDRVVASVTRSRDSGEIWEDTFPLRGKDGKYRWFLSRAYPIRDAQGNIIRWFGTNTDVTEQRELNEALRDADRRKDEFIATLAHELRNPLAPLRNGLQVMKLMTDQPDRVEEVRDIMERQVEQMVHLIDDLMDVSRITRGKVQLRKARIDLKQPIEAAIETSRPLIEESGHRLTVAMPTQPIFVDADVTRLAQIVANLLNNAAKYTDRGGTIKLSVERQRNTAVITVRDSGVGIPFDMLDSVFEPFAQVDRSLEKSQGGLGIGLSLVKGLVEMHGGTVEAKSDGPGKGSEFVVHLPTATEQASDPASSGENGQAAAPTRRVLVVDDNRDAAMSLAMMLRLKGHEAHTAHDGLEAIKIAAETRPDVVLLDIGMPKLNGYDTARNIREQPWGKNVALIALTGWGHEKDRQKSQDAGFDHHLVKPVDQSELMILLAGVAG